MPWKKHSDQQQRWGFVRLVLRAKMGLAELCRRSGISRKTAYKWITRFKEDGRRGLKDQEHSAHRLHNRPQKKWLDRIRRSRRQHPNWGAPKIHWVLKGRFGRIGLPSEAAISRWLKSWGLSRGGALVFAEGPPGSGPPCAKRATPMMSGPSILRDGFAPAMASRLKC